MTALSPLNSQEFLDQASSVFRIHPGSVGEAEVRAIGGENNASIAVRCRQIIDYYREDSQNSEHELARWLVEQLSQEEQEVAAKCSYAYWFLSRCPSVSNNTSGNTSPRTFPEESVRFSAAMREAIRHKDCSDDPKEVLRLFKATLGFHATYKTRLYRTCMVHDDESSHDCAADQALSLQRRKRINEEMTQYQINVVRGHDREDRAIFYALPRKQAGTPDQEQNFVDSIVYTLERAIACSELQSIGRQDEIFCVVDTKGGSCPPFKTLTAAVGILQKYYPGRLKHCAVVNAPYFVSGIFKMLKPFLDPVTAQKFVFPKSSHKSKHHHHTPHPVISNLIDESQATPILMPEKGRLTSEVDVNRLLYHVPFCELYDYAEAPGVTKGSLLQKPRSAIEYRSMDSLPLTESSSFDSDVSQASEEPRTRRFRFPRKFLRGLRKKGLSTTEAHSRHSVSVRSLAVGALASDAFSEESSPKVIHMKVHRSTDECTTTAAASVTSRGSSSLHRKLRGGRIGKAQLARDLDRRLDSLKIDDFGIGI